MAHKTKEGTWRVRWRVAGKMFSRTFTRKLDADTFERQIKLGLIDIREASYTTFKDFAEKWLEDHCKVKKVPSQWQDDRYTLDRHLIPAFGTKMLRDLKLRDLISFQASLTRKSGKPLSPRTINKICGMARKIMADATAWDYIRVNPFSEFTKIPQQTPKFDFWTREETSKFVAYALAEESELHDLVVVALNTGMRLGELRGLLRDSVDFDQRLITVRRSFCSRTRKLQLATKTKLIRHVPMNALVMAVLKDRRGDSPEDPIFKMSFENIRRKFRALIKGAKVHEIRFHDLRHTFASHLAMAGIPITVIRDLLGHTDIKMTSRYSHLVPSALASATDVLVVPPPAEPPQIEESKA